MPDKSRLLAQIENAAEIIPQHWPLRTFIAANPLAGFEEMPFEQAVNKGLQYFNGRGLPDETWGKKALTDGLITKDDLQAVGLQANGKSKSNEAQQKNHTASPQRESSLRSPSKYDRHNTRLNALMIKYLSAFLDEGQAGWAMPGRENGFYRAWKALAAHDTQIPNRKIIGDLPDTARKLLLELTGTLDDEQRDRIFRRHLSALPGWTGYIKWRARQKHHPWQIVYPINLTQYVAVRLMLEKLFFEDIIVHYNNSTYVHTKDILWLKARERRFRLDLLNALSETPYLSKETPDAQLVFCIDVRSEVFRRHLEKTGRYETFGFAGFFGVPIRHSGYGEDMAAASCPVLLQPQFATTETPCAGHEKNGKKYLAAKATFRGLAKTLASLKNDIAATFATVEATGLFYGLGMIGRTLFPRPFQTLVRKAANAFIPDVALEPTIKKTAAKTIGLTLSERIFHAEAALSIIGLTENFAPLVLLCGHGSETVNNPYASGLDCGACGGNHGGPNARVMAAIFNDADVREGLRERGIDIPDTTVFAGAEHNTTTDDLEIYWPYGYDEPTGLSSLRANLVAARDSAARERARRLTTKHSPSTRAADWAEVRPEWGLAGNAAFIVAHRNLTKDLDLEGRSFLHSYDWKADEDGKALEIIMTAPLVVAQWINTQYYFSTLDNGVYGSGSKTTHNVTGKIGVMQGNASDLMNGLPLQSVMAAYDTPYHEPLRLQAVIDAPLSRVTKIITRNDILQTLFDNEWVILTVRDPEKNHFREYTPGGIWIDPVTKQADTEAEDTDTRLFTPQKASRTSSHTDDETVRHAEPV